MLQYLENKSVSHSYPIPCIVSTHDALSLPNGLLISHVNSPVSFSYVSLMTRTNTSSFCFILMRPPLPTGTPCLYLVSIKVNWLDWIYIISYSHLHKSVKHRCPRWQQSPIKAKISKFYILTPPPPFEGRHVITMKSEQPLDELTNKQTDRQNKNKIFVPFRTFIYRGLNDRGVIPSKK